MIKKIQNLLEQMTLKHKGILAAAVVNIEDGMPIAEVGKHPEIDIASAAAYLASIVKSNNKAIGLLADGRDTDDIMITTSRYHFVIRHMEGLPMFIFFMANKEKWLAMAKSMLK